MTRPISLHLRGRSIEARLEIRGAEARLERDGRTIIAQARREGAWIEIRIGERAARCAVAPAPHGVWVGSEGSAYLFEVPRGEGLGGAAEGDPDQVRAPMTGRVVAVAVPKGAAVREGDPLVTVEAMKMEFRLVSPRDGTIGEIACAEGDRVELGQLLVRLAPTGEPRPDPAATGEGGVLGGIA